VSRSTFFKPSPASGVIPPGQSASIVVRYEPKNLGTHVDQLKVGRCRLTLSNPN
jgi:hypothetical protein